MIDLEQIVECLSIENLMDVHRDTGIHYQQLWRLKKGHDKNPTYKIVKKLSDYFDFDGSLSE